MKNILSLLRDETAQDLVEYAMVVALIALGAVLGIHAVAGSINNAFSTIGNVITSNIS